MFIVISERVLSKKLVPVSEALSYIWKKKCNQDNFEILQDTIILPTQARKIWHSAIIKEGIFWSGKSLCWIHDSGTTKDAEERHCPV